MDNLDRAQQLLDDLKSGKLSDGDYKEESNELINLMAKAENDQTKTLNELDDKVKKLKNSVVEDDKRVNKFDELVNYLVKNDKDGQQFDNLILSGKLDSNKLMTNEVIAISKFTDAGWHWDNLMMVMQQANCSSFFLIFIQLRMANFINKNGLPTKWAMENGYINFMESKPIDPNKKDDKDDNND
jgi:hypothetical protein